MMKIELLNARLSLVGRHLFPLGIFVPFFAAVLAISQALRVNKKLLPCATLLEFYFFAGFTTGIFGGIYRVCIFSNGGRALG